MKRTSSVAEAANAAKKLKTLEKPYWLTAGRKSWPTTALAIQWKLNASDAALPLNSGGRMSEIMIAGIGPAPQAKARMYSSVNERHMSGRVIAMPRTTMHVAMQANEPASNGLRPTRSM